MTQTVEEQLASVLTNQATFMNQITNTLTIVGQMSSDVANLKTAVAAIPTTAVAPTINFTPVLNAITSAVTPLAAQLADVQKQLET